MVLKVAEPATSVFELTLQEVRLGGPPDNLYFKVSFREPIPGRGLRSFKVTNRNVARVELHGLTTFGRQSWVGVDDRALEATF